MAPPRIELSSGVFVVLPALLAVSVPVLARAARLPVDELLDEVERWAAGPGAMYGVRVDREAQTITQ